MSVEARLARLSFRPCYCRRRADRVGTEPVPTSQRGKLPARQQRQVVSAWGFMARAQISLVSQKAARLVCAGRTRKVVFALNYSDIRNQAWAEWQLASPSHYETRRQHPSPAFKSAACIARGALAGVGGGEGCCRGRHPRFSGGCRERRVYQVVSGQRSKVHAIITAPSS